MTFTKEQLIEKLQRRIAVAANCPDLEEAQFDAAIFKIALASLEAEAVGEVVLGEYDDCGCHPDASVVCIAADGQADWENFKDGTRLFTAPPTSVVNAEPVSFDDLRDAVAEVSGGPAMEWSDIYKGHQAVPFINFNSLARIVDKFRTAAPVVPDALKQFAEFMAAESIKAGDYPDGWRCKAANAAHEYAQACRAAMLEAPANN
ncbi:hypothetical protein [Cronobacter dublinensis]|uniref:hypothetical protein n=1 Tax=Cronobacter dublinensis TaxID=413497 RepID=UPI00300DBFDB